MKINDFVKPFLVNYEATTDYYEEYFQMYPEVFDFYFQFHCKNKEEKLERALQCHPQMLKQMQWIAERIPPLTEEIAAKYADMFSLEVTQDVQLFVGLGGSMAYTTHAMIPNIAFSVDRITPDEDAIKTIIAHEIGHAMHHMYTDKVGIAAVAINWSSPYTWLLQEGIATYLSMQVVEVAKDVYFAFGRDEKWLQFVEDNLKQIITEFEADLQQQSASQLFIEWFSINGGERFGYKALAYYIGYLVVQALVKQYGIEQTLIIWEQADVKEIIHKTLLQLKRD